MPSIFLLRHCAYDNPRHILPGRLPVELSPEGREHAQRLGAFFATQRIGRIYSSAVRRCQQTAEIIANNSIPITFDSRLLETFSAYQGYWEENTHALGYHFYTHQHELGGERFIDLHTRMADFWDSVAACTNENLILCSHGDPLMALYAHIHQQTVPENITPQQHLDGWLEYGQFMEIMMENGKLGETKQARTV